MTTALTIACSKTTYPFVFPATTKSPPLEIVSWFLSTICSMGYLATFVRVDEDGSLARSSEFCQLIVDSNCILHTTGGGNSEANGKVERTHRTLANMVGSFLSTAKIIIGNDLPNHISIDSLWCFALQFAAYTLRRTYNRQKGDTPYHMVHGKKPSIHDLIMFGSIVTIVNPNKNILPKLSPDRAKQCYFLGYGNRAKNINTGIH